MNAEKILAEVIGRSYPVTENVGSGWLRRDWVIRTVNSVPEMEGLLALGSRLGYDVFAAMVAAYGGVSSPETLENARPEYLLIRVDEHHLVVRVTFAGPERALGDEGVISQVGFLQRLDQALGIDDLQGIPRTRWFFLRDKPE